MAKTNYFGPVQSTEEAEKTLKEMVWVLYGLGALSIGVAYFLMPSMIFDGVVWVILGFLLSKFRNKIVAGLIIAFALVSFGSTILAKAGVLEGGQNIFLAAIVLWASYRVWMAVSYLKKNHTSSIVATK